MCFTRQHSHDFDYQGAGMAGIVKRYLLRASGNDYATDEFWNSFPELSKSLDVLRAFAIYNGDLAIEKKLPPQRTAEISDMLSVDNKGNLVGLLGTEEGNYYFSLNGQRFPPARDGRVYDKKDEKIRELYGRENGIEEIRKLLYKAEPTIGRQDATDYLFVVYLTSRNPVEDRIMAEVTFPNHDSARNFRPWGLEINERTEELLRPPVKLQLPASYEKPFA
jgi:hypothetical protein